ncbi:MAG: hypothetical protein ACC630_06090 [Nitrospinota bacterium]
MAWTNSVCPWVFSWVKHLPTGVVGTKTRSDSASTVTPYEDEDAK